MKLVTRLLSHFYPIRVERRQGKHGPLEIMLEYGRLVLNSARANQSFGGLHRVWQRSFAAVRLKERRIARVLLLGLGAGSVVHILRRELRIMAPIVAVDDDPVMVKIARDHFDLGHHADVEVVIDDAFTALERIKGAFDLIVVDIFTEMDVPVALVEQATVARLGALRSPQGLLMINIIPHDVENTQRTERLLKSLGTVGSVTVLRPMPPNRVFVVGA